MPGDDSEESYASSLTATQKEVITELQKILLALNQINDSLGKTIALTKDDGEVVQAHREVTETGMTVFSFDEEEEEEDKEDEEGASIL